MLRFFPTLGEQGGVWYGVGEVGCHTGLWDSPGNRARLVYVFTVLFLSPCLPLFSSPDSEGNQEV